MKNIILIGMPGAGKSTVGVLLAKSMGYDFVDADLVIQKQQGTKLQNIIDERGLDGFKQAEEQALLSINDKKSDNRNRRFSRIFDRRYGTSQRKRHLRISQS